jgi:hypothetical protein
LVQAQRLTRKPEESAREALRVARAVQVDLELNSGKQRVVTLDICIGGFSTMMGVPPEPNEAVGVTMRMPEVGGSLRQDEQRQGERILLRRDHRGVDQRLGQYPGLRVASRTSAFALKGKGLDARQIGDKLGVKTLLEGSVRREGMASSIASSR